MKKYKIASILMLFHGELMELGGTVLAMPLVLWGSDAMDIGGFFSLIVPYLQDNLTLMLIMGAVFGTGADADGLFWGSGDV